MRTKDRIIDLKKRIESLKNELESETKELNKLQRQYDQERLSDLTKNGIKNKETRQWWMNRY